MKSRISIWAVFVGGIADIVATNLLQIPVLLLWVMPNMAGHSGAEFAAAVKKALASDQVLFGLLFLLGGLCSVLGGYIAARIAKRSEVLNGALAAWLCVAIGVFGLFGRENMTSRDVLLIVLDVPLSVALSALGGWLRSVGHRSES